MTLLFESPGLDPGHHEVRLLQRQTSSANGQRSRVALWCRKPVESKRYLRCGQSQHKTRTPAFHSLSSVSELVREWELELAPRAVAGFFAVLIVPGLTAHTARGSVEPE